MQAIARALTLALLLPVALAPRVARAQQDNTGLHGTEVEKHRDSNQHPAYRIQLFMEFLTDRTDDIHALFATPRRPGREEDVHDLMQQFDSIASEFDDNLTDYAKDHPDLRKILPKLIDAAARWATELKSPPPNQAYDVTRKIALDSVGDIRDDATQMFEAQKKWFADHPPGKDKKPK